MFVFMDIESMFSANEVGGWGNIPLMGFGLAVTATDKDGDYKRHNTPISLRNEIFKPGVVIVTFNGKAFDMRIISNKDNYFHIDILDIIRKKLGHRISLASIGMAQDDPKPDGMSSDSPRMIRDGKLDEVFNHCERDVRILRNAFYEAVSTGSISYINKKGEKVKVSDLVIVPDYISNDTNPSKG